MAIHSLDLSFLGAFLYFRVSRCSIISRSYRSYCIFNYGDAWYEGVNQPAFNDMIGAQGYNLDLQTDIKGITVNLGTGVGQVFGKNWELYILFGFDAIVNI